MEILDVTEGCFVVVDDDDDLLNFTLEGDRQLQQIESNATSASPSSSSPSSSSLESSNPETTSFRVDTQNCSFPEFVEEDLEWLSNKDAFPSVETCFGILSDNPELILNHHSPVSVLESNNNNNSNALLSCCDSLKVPTNYPVRARSKRRRIRRTRTSFGDLTSHQCLWLNQVNVKNKQELLFSPPPMPTITNSGASMGRRCLHCQSDKTPQWRAGPMGPKTLCNACGVRYKSGRLLPEYRPASSPTFSSTLHSNSHRKVVEMRKLKQQTIGGIIVG
ncbi:hypothetical protein BUALT_Bualt12G0103300 [Buddleja alternifolia]|uniref:GATA-type domain-containing protein n=1 Tax=Buddleja alternifolia TaxID=168488 RepID=A0AAV6WWW5_9LAMI|nr:hypothetical protein BUALT_Bualt12G0103300 [Buddleja alternifolia]